MQYLPVHMLKNQIQEKHGEKQKVKILFFKKEIAEYFIGPETSRSTSLHQSFSKSNQV